VNMVTAHADLKPSAAAPSDVLTTQHASCPVVTPLLNTLQAAVRQRAELLENDLTEQRLLQQQPPPPPVAEALPISGQATSQGAWWLDQEMQVWFPLCRPQLPQLRQLQTAPPECPIAHRQKQAGKCVRTHSHLKGHIGTSQ